MHTRFMRAGALMIALLGLQACGSARVFYQDQQGGVLILDGDEDKALDDASAKMAAHCGPGRYEIVKREMVTVGSEAYASQQTDYGEREDKVKDGEVIETRDGFVASEDSARETRGTSVTNAVSGVRELRETRVTYVCR